MVVRGMMVVVCVGLVLAGSAWAQEEKPFLLSSFEPGGPDWVKGDGKVVAEHATDGRNAVMLESNEQGYPQINITDPGALRRFKDYVLLRVDVYNPQDSPVRFGVRVDDAKSNSYGTRYNDDGATAAPGKSTIDLNLTGLTRSMARNFLERDKLDLSQLKLVAMFMHPRRQKIRLYFDNVRLEGSGLPKVEGLRALDFGPAKSAVYPGFEGVNEQMTWNDERGFGWIAPQRFRRLFMPDDLGCDFVCGREFRMKLPNGDYEVNLGIDVIGEWGMYYHYQWRRLFLNDRKVLDEKWTGADFMRKVYYRHEDSEDLPGLDVWEKFIAPVNNVRRFTVKVTDGTLGVKLTANNPLGQVITFMVVYPDAQQDAGRKWMAALDKLRRERFANAVVVGVPPAPKHKFRDTRGRDSDFVLFVRHTSRDIPVNAVPTPEELLLGMPSVSAAKGERAQVQIGLYPTREVKGVTVKVSDFTGKDGATIPSSAIRVRKVRNFLKRLGPSSEGRILPYILQDFETLDIVPGVTRGVWLTLVVPRDAKPGLYSGTVTVSGDAAVKRQFFLTVYPFELEPARSITLSVTGTTAGRWRNWFPDFDEKWWQQADAVMKDLADHGMNAVTGGPGAQLRAVRNGKPDIDYADMDRWLALAVKHGLTMPGDSYQGLSVRGIPLNMSRDCMKVNEQQSRQKFGVSYADLIRIVFADVARHAKEKNWPPRVYYLLDEPRPEYGNVGPCLELTKLFTKAAPETLFSGYYSLGGGRDPYFETMPVSIAHFKPEALALVKKGGKQLWDYDGNRVRHNIGRWAFKASKAGLKGYLRNGFMYVCCDPYFDFSEDEGSWAVVYPSKNGLNASVGWERTGQGAADFAYMEMLDELIARARAAGKAKPEAEAAAAYLAKTLAPIQLENRGTANLAPAEWDAFRKALADHIIALRKALGE